MAFLYVAAFFMTFVALVAKRTQENEGNTRTFRYALTKSSLEFLIPLDVVLLFYLVAYLIIPSQWEEVPVESLIRWEQRLETMSILTGGLKFSAFAIFIVFVVLWVAGLLRAEVRRVQEPIRDAVVGTNRWIGRAYVVLVLLASFTLLGTQAGSVSSEVKLRIKVTRDGYADLRRDIADALTEEIAYRTAERAYAELPPRYRDALAQVHVIAEKKSELSATYSTARVNHGVESPAVDRVLYAAAVDPPQNRALLARSTAPTAQTEPPPKITYRNIQEARDQIKSLREKRHRRANWFIESPGGRDVILQIPKLVTYATTRATLESLKGSYPILDPLVDVITEAIDERVSHAVNRRLDAVRDAALANPKKAAIVIEEEVVKIVAGSKIAASDTVRSEAERAAGEVSRQLGAIDAARSDVERRVTTAARNEIDREIGRLSASKEDVREAAVTRLVELGPRMERRHVGRLASLAQQSEPSWTVEDGREHHCTWYLETSVRYYAGRVLRSCGSPHVTSRVSDIAERAYDKGQRRYKVTDPGWI